jgi:hypothetical protein
LFKTQIGIRIAWNVTIDFTLQHITGDTQ